MHPNVVFSYSICGVVVGCCWSLHTFDAHLFQAHSLALSGTVGIFLEPQVEEVSLMLPETILGGWMTML
jgi:hypothetical protein